jgi:hypothetical protein
VFENGVLRKIFVPKSDKITGVEKANNKELYDLFG